MDIYIYIYIYLSNQASDPFPVWFYGRVFVVSGSNSHVTDNFAWPQKITNRKPHMPSPLVTNQSLTSLSAKLWSLVVASHVVYRLIFVCCYCFFQLTKKFYRLLC